MANANTLPLAGNRILARGFRSLKDPGASGTFEWHSKDWVICSVVTATTESRALPTAGVSYPVGTKITVVFKTDGGDLTLTGASASVVLTAAGDVVTFQVTDVNGTLGWRIVESSPLLEAFATLNAALPADTSGATELPDTETAAANTVAILELTAALATAGVISDAFTQATS